METKPIDDSSPNQALDAWIAQHVMGEPKPTLPASWPGRGVHIGSWELIPTEHGCMDFIAHPFSSNISESWRVVEKLVSMGKVFIVKGDGLRHGDHNPKWTVLCDNQPRVDRNTAPLAICVAAKNAIEGAV